MSLLDFFSNLENQKHFSKEQSRYHSITELYDLI